MTTYVDTSAFYAAADRTDRSHERAVTILSSADDPLTSDHVVVATWLLLRNRLGQAVAERWWGAVRSGACRIEHVGEADLAVAWLIGETFADQDFSIVDRTSFAMMQRLGVHDVVSFDDDFAIFRFGPQRRRAFDVIR